MHFTKFLVPVVLATSGLAAPTAKAVPGDVADTQLDARTQKTFAFELLGGGGIKSGGGTAVIGNEFRDAHNKLGDSISQLRVTFPDAGNYKCYAHTSLPGVAQPVLVKIPQYGYVSLFNIGTPVVVDKIKCY